MNSYNIDLLIIGAGPVGIFSNYQAGFLGMKTLTVDALDEIGGQPQALYPTKAVYDIPGFKSILAKDLIKKLKEQADQFDSQYLLSRKITDLECKVDGSFQVKTSKEDVINCKAILIAAGAGAFVANRPPLEDIEIYEDSDSVHYFIKNPNVFKDKEIVIAGGGDSAIDWVIELQNIAKKIYVVHRRDNFRAVQSNVDKVRELASKGNKVELVIPYMLDSLKGQNGMLEQIIVKTLKGEKKILKAQHLLAFFGLVRSLGALEHWGFVVNKLNSSIKVNPATFETNIKGIFAVGDIANYENKLKLIATGFAESSGAIHYAWKYIFPDKVFHFVHSSSK